MNKSEIRRVREKAGMTQEEFGQLLHCSDTRIAMLESEKYDTDLSASELVKLVNLEIGFDLLNYLGLETKVVCEKQIAFYLEIIKAYRLLLDQEIIQRKEREK